MAKSRLWLCKYEHFKNFTLSPASSSICMTSLPKSIGYIFGSWAIPVLHMTYITHKVFEISCLQAFYSKFKLSPAYYAYQLNWGFYSMDMYTLANNISKLNMKPNRLVVV